jgi:undecaprenyl-diphosphatase
MLAYVVIRILPMPWHLPGVLLASAMAFTIGCSRVFIQVHFASDVVAGFASGTAWLALCIGGIELIRYRRRTRP